MDYHIRLEPPKPTSVYDTYWHFAAERQNIFFERLAGAPSPWTDDPILQNYRFTNAYRASDRVSQFLIRHVIQEDDRDLDETFFRIILFKTFNRISTWEMLQRETGSISLSGYAYDRYDDVISRAMAAKHKVFSSAYIMPSGRSSFGSSSKHQNYLRLIELMIADALPSRLQDCSTMKEAVDLLETYPMIGRFLSYQFVTDLNYSSKVIDFSEMQYVKPGPGAQDGIAKCFSSLGDYDEAGVIEWVTERQDDEFRSRDIKFRDLWGHSLQLIDCQNLFCEISKYARVAHPTVLGVSGRTRIKQKYAPVGPLEPQRYPIKWGLNERIAQDGTTK